MEMGQETDLVCTGRSLLSFQSVNSGALRSAGSSISYRFARSSIMTAGVVKEEYVIKNVSRNDASIVCPVNKGVSLIAHKGRQERR